MSDNHKIMSDAIRFLCVDAIEKSNSGHPGMPLGMADVATVLFSKFLKLYPSQPRWFNRDRFVLSNGHGSMLLYSILYLLGYNDIDLEDIKNFRQLGSKTAGHPEFGHLAGIDMTTGPLGQGIATAVGMALGESILRARYGIELCNHHTYAICGDGCLQEGISEEAISLAGHLKLHKLILLWDNNDITIDGKVSNSSSTDQIKRFEANGWDTYEVDGHDPDEIEEAIASARHGNKPALIACKTIIGYGAPSKQGTSACHGAPLGPEEAKAMKRECGWKHEPFTVTTEAMKLWRSVGDVNEERYKAWFMRSHMKGQAFLNLLENKSPKNWDKDLNELKKQAITEKTKVATRKASQMCLEKIVPNIPHIIGGSADLAASNLTTVKGMKQITPDDHDGNIIAYGIREHAMTAVMNGLNLHGGFLPYGGTFFVFSDYMRPAMRLAALMRTQSIYILTHDSIGVGEDGPTHQPIEHLASFRAMPNILTFRPCDVVETAESWQLAIENECGPSILALSRQNLPMLRTDSNENLTAKGAYVISDVSKGKKRDATILATGSEVSMAVTAQEELRKEGIEVAVVSIPCWGLFDKQSDKYHAEVLGTAPRIAVEAAAKFGWERYVGLDGDIIGMDGFGASGKAEELYEHFGITVEEVIDSVKDCIKGKKKKK